MGKRNSDRIRQSKELRKTLTKAETVLWKALRRSQLNGLRIRRQHPIGPFIVDFYCFKRKFVIEVDGEEHYGRPDYDQKRTEFLESKGLRVIRYQNKEVLNSVDGVILDLKQKLDLKD